jgi:hypothetical protein
MTNKLAKMWAPPYAASTMTWTFGNQTWSDAIHYPECNKGTFQDSYSDPQCRSYTEEGKTWYYYNWVYVDANKETMCPAPWRMPSKSDFNTLVSVTNYATLISAWGYGGRCISSGALDGQDMFADYWSSQQNDGSNAYNLYYYSSNLGVNATAKYYGFQVRCVK